jgi:hypothetical protein
VVDKQRTEAGAEPAIDKRIAEFAGSVSYPPGFLEHERQSWDREHGRTDPGHEPDDLARAGAGP